MLAARGAGRAARGPRLVLLALAQRVDDHVAVEAQLGDLRHHVAVHLRARLALMHAQPRRRYQRHIRYTARRQACALWRMCLAGRAAYRSAINSPPGCNEKRLQGDNAMKAYTRIASRCTGQFGLYVVTIP